jgi:ankyrin repeat protein
VLHLVADWPGYFPNGPQIVHLLIEAGADPSFRHPTRCDETALHWAASSDDVDVAAALADGADINASPDYAHGQTALEVAGDADTMRQALVDWLKERAAAQA